MNQRHLAKTSRWRRFSGIAIFLFLALIGWKIWFTRVEKRIIRLEKVVWFENLGTFPEEIKTLRGIRFSLLPPRLQARRCGLLGDWRLSQGDESRATALYEFEALLNVGINSSWLDVVDLAHHPNSARKAILDRIHDEQIEFSIPDDRIDTSCLTSRLLPLPDEENAYFALANLPPFRDQVIIKEKIDPFTFSANEIETAREYLAKNRDVLAKWDAVIDSFSKMRNPADAAFVRLDLAMKTHFCRFRIALADGDESGACESLSRIYRTLNILESDGMLVYSLVAVAMRGKMCITLKSLQIPASVRSRMAGIIRLHPADSNVAFPDRAERVHDDLPNDFRRSRALGRRGVEGR